MTNTCNDKIYYNRIRTMDEWSIENNEDGNKCIVGTNEHDESITILQCVNVHGEKYIKVIVNFNRQDKCHTPRELEFSTIRYAVEIIEIYVSEVPKDIVEEYKALISLCEDENKKEYYYCNYDCWGQRTGTVSSIMLTEQEYEENENNPCKSIWYYDDYAMALRVARG